nr:F-box only protein 8-like [Ipomoea batatas]
MAKREKINGIRRGRRSAGAAAIITQRGGVSGPRSIRAGLDGIGIGIGHLGTKRNGPAPGVWRAGVENERNLFPGNRAMGLQVERESSARRLVMLPKDTWAIFWDLRLSAKKTYKFNTLNSGPWLTRLGRRRQLNGGTGAPHSSAYRSVVLRDESDLSAFQIYDIDESGGARSGADGLEHSGSECSAIGMEVRSKYVIVGQRSAEEEFKESARKQNIKHERQMNNPSTFSSSTSITSLPQEILLKILTGLPAKSAVRFRCTSKFFYSFIPEPSFAFKILVSLPSKPPTELNLYSVSYREDSHGNLQADTAQRLDVRGLLCSADGKMCVLRPESGNEVVFDLSTGRRICLPIIGWPAGRVGSSFSCCLCSNASLGFDSVSEKYKVFKSEVHYDYDCRRLLNRSWVLTVGVDKSWREIHSTIPGNTTTAAVHIHGIMYLIREPIAEYLARFSLLFSNLYRSLSAEPKIVAIDVATERFIKSIPFPFEYYSLQHHQGWRAWMKLNGRLAFINILCSQRADGVLTPWPDSIDIWRLERSMEFEKQTVVLPLEEREVIGEATSIKYTVNSMGEIVFLIHSKKGSRSKSDPSPLSSRVSAVAHEIPSEATDNRSTVAASPQANREDQEQFKKMDATTSPPATCIASLPHEIILKILTILPPKSAVSFRCTSKFFHSSIPQPHFAFRILFSFPSARHPINLYTVGYTEESHGWLQATSLQCSEELQSFKRLVSSSFADGKLCLFNIHGEITLWDLSTRQHISLPRNNQTSVGSACEGPKDPWRITFSRADLDFDSVSKRNKVLKSELYHNTHRQCQGMLRVLTLGVDQYSWRSVTINSFPGKPSASVQIDGIIYFINCKKENGKDKQDIVIFDIEKRNLRVIPFPYVLQNSFAYSSWVKLNGRLAYVYVHIKSSRREMRDAQGLRTNIYVYTLEKSMRWEMHKVALTLEECEIFRQANSMSFTTNGIGEIVFLIRFMIMPPSILIYACGRQVWKKFENIKLQRQMHNPSTSSSSTSITYLPQEILLKILTGLPAKSAVRFRCTSKFFYSFIPEPRFEFRILVSLPSKPPSELNLYSVSYREDSHGNNLQADTAQRLDVPGLVSSADDKMCLLSLESRDDAVFDLSTGRRICLPRIGRPGGRSALSITSCVWSNTSLGFDSVSERYKVFKSAMYYDYDFRRMLNQLWILTVGVDKSWREIDSTILGYTKDVVHIHGIMYLIHEPITEHYWTRLSLPFSNLFHSSSTEPKIVAMDIATERFITPQKDGVLTPWPDRIDIWRLERSMEWEKRTVVLPLEEREVIGEAISMKFTANSMGEIVFLIQRMELSSAP